MSTDSNEITLVIFACEGREHLLCRTIASFHEACNHRFSKTLLVVDGPFEAAAIANINADVVIHHTKRQGYVNVIANALKLIDTPLYFWLEDDFLFNQKIPLSRMLDVINTEESWAGIFLSRTGPLTSAEKKHKLFDDLVIPDFGFSVSPSLCKTKHVKSAFAALMAYPKGDSTKHTSFEPFIDSYFIQQNLKYAMVDPGPIAHVEHIGFLESSGREYHMINALEKEISDIDKTFISGLGKERVITLYNKLAMLPKLWYAVGVLSFNLFWQRRAYDFAFRIYCAYLKKFKY